MHTFHSFFHNGKYCTFHSQEGVLIGQKHIDILLLHLLRDATENIHLFQNGLLGYQFLWEPECNPQNAPCPPERDKDKVLKKGIIFRDYGDDPNHLIGPWIHMIFGTSA